MRRLPTIIVLSLTMAACGNNADQQDAAQSCPPNALTIADGTIRAVAEGAPTTGVFFSICNETGSDDRLIGASFSPARATEIHTTETNDEGMSVMRKIDGIDAPAGARIDFEPGGAHIMVIGPEAAIETGESYSLTLEFENAGALVVDLEGADLMSGHAGH